MTQPKVQGDPATRKQKGTLLKLLNTLDDREAKGDDKIFK